jgi:lysophospholipid acyltransferase (LPLAT)-like uncharacterized protein
MALLMASLRVRVGIGEQHFERVLASSQPVVLAFWHNRMAVCGDLIHRRMVRRGRPVAVLASLSRDGELAARMGRARGFRMIRGSTSRGGLAGLLKLHRAISREGCSVATAPDGPRGPAYEAQLGTVMLAKLAGAPIVPLAYAASRTWRLRSWDRLVVPKPFARAIVAVGAPLEVAADLSDTELVAVSAELKRRLDGLVERAEALVQPDLVRSSG